MYLMKMMDLLTSEEEKIDNQTRQDGLDIPLLSKWLIGRTKPSHKCLQFILILEQRHQTNFSYSFLLRQKNRGIAIVQTKSGRGARYYLYFELLVDTVLLDVVLAGGYQTCVPLTHIESDQPLHFMIRIQKSILSPL